MKTPWCKQKDILRLHILQQISHFKLLIWDCLIERINRLNQLTKSKTDYTSLNPRGTWWCRSNKQRTATITLKQNFIIISFIIQSIRQIIIICSFFSLLRCRILCRQMWRRAYCFWSPIPARRIINSFWRIEPC